MFNQHITCTGKNRYEEKKYAKIDAKRFQKKFRKRFKIYLCVACNCFHLSTRITTQVTRP